MLYVTTRLSSLTCVFERFRTASYPMFLLVMFCFMLFVSRSISLWGLGGNLILALEIINIQAVHHFLNL